MKNSSQHWRLLDYGSWNNYLFDATFSGEPGSPNARDPVIHIDTSDDFLAMIGARMTGAGERALVLTRFDEIVGRDLRRKPIDACLEWDPKEPGLPSVYAILFYLCRVASMQENFGVNGFYDKLSAKTEYTHRATSKLADTWERLQGWLSKNPRYRPLELPTYPTFAQIGTTLGLTFPRGRDATALKGLLGSHPELSLVTLSFRSVRALFHKGVLRNFTQGFQDVFENFEGEVDSGKVPMAELARHPFWRAVLRVQRELETASPEVAVSFAIYEPEENPQAFLVASEESSLGKYTSASWPGVLEEGEGVLRSDDGDFNVPLREVFEGTKPHPPFARLRRAIRTRVLPLTGTYIHDPGRQFPRLLRWSPEVALPLADAVMFRGDTPSGFAPTDICVGGLTGWRLAAPVEKASPAGPLPDAFLMRLRRGIRAGRGTWLAAMGFLPEVIVPDAINVELVGGASAKKGKDGAWRFVQEPTAGKWTLRATLSDGRILQQELEFVGTAFTGSYGVPPEKSGFVEWGGPPTVSEHPSYSVDVRQRQVDNESWDGSMPAEASRAAVAFDTQSSNRIYFGLVKGVFSRSQRAGLPLGVDLLELRVGTPRVSWSQEYATPPSSAIHLVKDERLKYQWGVLVDHALAQNVIPQGYVHAFARVRKPRTREDFVHVEPDLRRRIFKQPRRQHEPIESRAQSTRPFMPRSLLVVLDAVAKQRKNGLAEPELLQLCASALGAASAERWHLVRALCESAILTPHHNGQWSGRSYYAVKPHLRMHHAFGGWIATLVGLTDASIQRGVARRLEKMGGAVMPALTSADGYIQVSRWQFQELETVLSASLQDLGLEMPQFVPRVEAVADSILSLVRRIPTARRLDELPRVEQPRCFAWGQGDFSRTRREHAFELWRIARHGQADEYVLERNEKPFISFFSRTVAILAAYALRGELPWLTEGRDLQMKPGCYLPLPLARILAFSGESLPGWDNGAYFYHFASEDILKAVTACMGFVTGAEQ